ncbi:ribosomal RNA small subunit methyltransferase H [Globomyces pollinis-pini]|nr:ribosomal RNA small subunit methyltransferase H [Globomyces pollinis-pini]
MKFKFFKFSKFIHRNQSIKIHNQNPIFLKESINHLIQKNILNPIYCDATFGTGGHTKALLDNHPNCIVIAIDHDPFSIDYAIEMSNIHSYKGRLFPVQGKFGNVEKIVKQTLQNQFPDRFIDRPCLDGIIFDVGLSTHQMSNPDRGFSFGQEGPLDMRMESRGRFDCTGDLGRTLTAEALVNTFNVDQLTEIFLKYGEEKQARKIALAIERHRNVTPITTTIQLAQIFAEGKGRAEQKLRKFAHPAIKPFMALRMFINNELSQLHEGLIGSESLLKPNANCLVITPHSIQDRIVKKFFKSCQHGIPNEIKLVNPNLKSKNSLRSLRLMKPSNLDDENVDIFDENYDSNNSTTFPTHSITQMDGNQTSKASFSLFKKICRFFE